MRFTFQMAILLLTLSVSQVVAADDTKRISFERDVRPILTKHCFACHGPDKQRGGLRFDRKTDAVKGGESGVAFVAGKGADSLLVQLVSGHDAERIMPPKGEKLTADQIGVLRAWVDQGAEWPNTTEGVDPLDWWSLKPLTRPTLPTLTPEDAKRVRNPVDQFILAKLRDNGLSPSPEADRRTLIRRLSFDLTGLPPTPDEIDAFINDPAPDAYERLVARLLASPTYGERWTRHWLDVVHYGDTHGYDKDQPRPNAWPYRDYLIRAFNSDKPYSRFVQEQVAGDVLFPGTADGVTALGFIAAGPWDLIGHAEVPETKIDGKIARHLDRDDMVMNTMGTFVSLTAHCAQCHNHKFDPIRQEDYYRLQAVFAAVDRADRPYHNDPATAERFNTLTAQRIELVKRQQEFTALIQKAAGPDLAALNAKIAGAKKGKQPRPEFGYHSQIAAKADVLKWVQVDLSESVPMNRVVLWGCHDDFNGIGAGFGYPARFKIETSDDAGFASGVHLVTDQTNSDVSNPGVRPQEFQAQGVTARYVRVTATKLASRQNDFILALAELEVFNATGTNLARGKQVTALDSIEAKPRWSQANLVDGHAPVQNGSADLPKLQQQRQDLITRTADPAIVKSLAAVTTELADVDTELKKLPAPNMVYAATVHNGRGAFRGTGPDGGKPRPIYLLKRGDVKTPAQEVAAGTLNVFRELSGQFDLPANHTEGERRAALAKWLTNPKNPLTWRSAVNRMWQYHFGRGIVGTPNDFGRMGQLPTHPELLDWLAVEFRDNGQSLKKLHRLLVTSATYRQVSSGNEKFDKIDAGNAYLWRMPRRKLEAEAIRDAALLVSGKLDTTMYGPPFKDFVVEHPEHSPHYEYHLHDPSDAKTYRRSVYRFLARSKPHPFMTALDCADPSMQVDKRTESLSPLQALALYNNGFMLTMAKHLAARVEKAGTPEAQITRAFRTALGRSPTPTERATLVEHAQTHGLPNTCRVILNLNEFVFVD